MSIERAMDASDPFSGCERRPREVIAALTAEDWAKLESLVEQIRAHIAEFGHWIPAETIGESAHEVGYAVKGPLISAVKGFMISRGFQLPGIEHAVWYSEYHEAANEAAVEGYRNASPELLLGQIADLLGNDYFTGGGLLGFDDGIMPRLLTRLLDFAPDADGLPPETRSHP